MQSKFDVNDPVLPRRRKVPVRYQVGASEGQYPETPKALYRQRYFECLDLMVTFIRDRFNQPDYCVLKNLEDLLLKSARNEEYQEELDLFYTFIKMISIHCV